MKNMVFIHGAYHGGWCWKEVEEEIKRKDNFVLCHLLTLPNHIDSNISSYVDYVVNYIKDNNLDNIVLVSHSLGGLVVAKLIEKINSISDIFLLTSVLVNNNNFLSYLPIDIQNKYKEIAKNHNNLIIPNPDRLKDVLFNKTSVDKYEYFSKNLTPQSYGAYEETVNIDVFKHTKIPTRYIQCKYDISLPQEIFKEIFKLLPSNSKIIEIDADHEAMASNPKEVARVIIEELIISTC